MDDVKTPVTPQCPIHTSLLEQIRASQDRLEYFMTGGQQPEKGVLIRLDRLEQNASNQRWVSRTALGAVIASAGMALWNLLKVGK